MRILFCTPCYKPYFGGIERVVEQLTRRLLAHPEVEAVGIMTSYYRFPSRLMEGLPAREEMDGATVMRMRFSPRRLPYFYHLDTGVVSSEMGRVIREFRPTHLQYTVYDWYLPNLQAYLLSHKKAAQIQSVYDHRFEPSFGTLPFQWVNRWLARRMDTVHVVSERARGIVGRTMGADDRKIKVVPLGAELRSVNRDNRNSGEPVTIVSVGRLSPNKGQIDLLNGFIGARKRATVPCRLVLVGDDGGDKAALRRIADEQGLTENEFVIAGHVTESELADWYEKADIFALLSANESFGLVYTEAMGRGLPVVAYNIGPLAELFPKGIILLPFRDLPALEETLAGLINDRRKRLALGDEALGFIADHCTWESVAQQMVDIYRQSAAGRS